MDYRQQTVCFRSAGRPVLSPSVLWPSEGSLTQQTVCVRSAGRPVLSPSVLWQPNPGHQLASKRRELCISFHLQAPFGWSVNSHTQAPQRAAILVHSSPIPVRSKKRLAYDAADTFAPHAGPAYDVTDTDCWTQNGNSLSCVSMTLC